jgi:predicted acylesterase/phospholipase RssA
VYEPDSRSVISSSEDGTVRFWSRPDGADVVLRPARPYERLNVYAVKGLSEAELTSLTTLGAVVDPRSIPISPGIEPAISSDEIEMTLVMKGGGIKALAYIGAIQELEKHYTFTRFVGTSGGAIMAVLLAAGYSGAELEDIVHRTDFRTFLDAWPHQWLTNMYRYGGLFEGRSFVTWLDRLLATKLRSAVRVTLGDLPERATVCASRRGRRALIFDSKDPKTSHISAAYAVRCSISIPFVFTPPMDEEMRVVDGGVQNNFPLDILLRESPATPFVGLYLGPVNYEGHTRIGLIGDLLKIWTEGDDAEMLRKYRDQIIVCDTRPISMLDFHVTKREKEFLIKVGRVSALRFLAARAG